VQQEESECDKEKGSWIKFKKESGMDTSRTQSSGPIFLSIPLKQVGSNKVQISYTILTTMPKDNIYDRIPAKPTMYNGRLYRSRLECRWAAFFDLLGWKYEYEPMDLNGWSPDFAIKVKYPKTAGKRFSSECPCEIIQEMDFGQEEILKCECNPGKIMGRATKLDHCKLVGQYYETVCLVEVKPIHEFSEAVAEKMVKANNGVYELLLLGESPLLPCGAPLGWLFENNLQWNFGWGEAIFTNTPGFAHYDGSFGCRIKGTSGGSDHDLKISYKAIEKMWAMAANQVMFLKPEVGNG
jgi:hypothetical protein